VHDMTS